ncbi:Listeria-Bacteroides repeat domain [Bacteroidales bacterium Barb7]|nr:Listeria-Bacteroides repeat domain [Bacteroidales bacterium Barb7]
MKWTNAKGDSLSADNPYKVIIKEDLDVRAYFVINSYRVSLLASDNGTINSGEYFHLYNTEAKAEAVANTGYYFVKWTDANGNSLSAANPYTFTVKGNMTVQAQFAANGYRVNVFAGDNGTIKSGDGVYAHNTKATVEASANTGYHFERWTNETGSAVSIENPYTFVVTGHTKILAHFGKNDNTNNNKYKVEVSARENGRIKSGGDSCLYGEKATVEAVADSGYHFVKWTDASGRMVSGDNPYTFVVTGDMVVEANFASNSFMVNLSAENGTIKSGRGVYKYESLATVEAEGNTDYFFVMWTDARGDSVSGENPYSFIVDRPTVLKAVYTKSFYEVAVAVTAAEHGRIKSGGGTFAYKSEVTVEAEPEEGYHFARWTDMNGDDVSSENPYRFIAAGDRILRAHFALGENFVSLTAAEHGRITFGAGFYAYGTRTEAVAAVDTGYHFMRWADSRGRTLSAENPYRFVVTGDMDIYAYFTVNSYYVSVTADYGATTSWTNRKIAYNEKATAEVELIAGNGYHFLKWIDAQGDSLSTANPYTFVVKGDMDLHAQFAPYKYFVTIDETEGGHTTGGGQYYDFGEQVLLTASADPGFHFTGWTAGDRLDIPASAERLFTFTITQTAFVNYKANFARGGVGNESFTHADARAYYADGVLHLVHLEGYILSVSTIDGRKVLQFKADDAEYSVAALPAGIYILNAASGKGGDSRQFKQAVIKFAVH